MNIKFRDVTIDDFEKLADFWKQNYRLDKTDDYQHFKTFLDKNPGLSVLAEDNGEIIGVSLASFDGRKGYVQKVTVRKDKRRQGLGTNLVLKTLARLKDIGALDIRVGCNEELTPFYERCGFSLETIAHLKIQQP